ncbi:hypothetical protein A8F69_34070 [Burkholderia cenocepacia]|nr:hypothetical protein A8F69_34070 [Burkholderia cenocepacia]OOB43240.1 hypothetical protein A8F74_08115 [Burkholderia cenocepacia]OOB45157.1 hypothetical protein A8F71_31890 [Burkholderia cenocepacia]OOB61535.1 hypothetical protein A8F75_09405 [Burkholderia cenocepacia]
MKQSLSGFKIDREGATIHVGTAPMFNLRKSYAQWFRTVRPVVLEHRLGSLPMQLRNIGLLSMRRLRASRILL